MAIVELNRGVMSMRGAVGNMVFKHYGDKIVVTRKPQFKNRVFSPAQRDAQDKFRQAMLQAKAAMADPGVRRGYEQMARPTRKPILSLLVGELLRGHGVTQPQVQVGAETWTTTNPPFPPPRATTATLRAIWWDEGSASWREKLCHCGTGMGSLCLSADLNHALWASRRL